jgi:hypothetical protein
VAGLAAAIELALELEKDDRRRRVERMAGRDRALRRVLVEGPEARNNRGSAYGSLTVETVLIIADERRLYVLSLSGSGAMTSGSSGSVPGSGGVTPPPSSSGMVSVSSGMVSGSSGSGSGSGRSRSGSGAEVDI